MQSSVIKRSVVVAGHKTSVSLENEFWNGLREIADGRGETMSELIAAIRDCADRQNANLSSAIRLFVLGFYRNHQSGMREQPNVILFDGAHLADAQ
jgi:predicted DNA-binding ribbon-helix-helix protein